MWYFVLLFSMYEMSAWMMLTFSENETTKCDKTVSTHRNEWIVDIF
jgi:hypothetical protein